MWKYNNTDELYHYGILGMRWGHRKSKINTMNKELKRYRKLEKEEKKKQKLNKIESERYKKANTGIKKFGVNKYIKGQKIARVGSAIGGALSANATLGAIRSTSRFIKRKQSRRKMSQEIKAQFIEIKPFFGLTHRCKSSQARDQTHTTAVTKATAVTMLDP